MANVIIKSDERRESERYVAQVFGADTNKASEREAVETIAARTAEAVATQRRD